MLQQDTWRKNIYLYIFIILKNKPKKKKIIAGAGLLTSAAKVMVMLLQWMEVIQAIIPSYQEKEKMLSKLSNWMDWLDD